MTQSLYTNIAGISAVRNMGINSAALNKAQNQISSGLITSDPSDSPARAAVGYTIQAMISSLTQAASTAVQTTAMIQLATGALGAANEILTQMNSLASQSASSTISNAERGMLDEEFQDLLSQIDKNAEITWGRTRLLSGGVAAANTGAVANLTFTPGAGADGTANYSLSYANTGVFTLTVTTATGVTSNLTGALSPLTNVLSTSIDDTVYFSDGSSALLTTFNATNAVAQSYFSVANAPSILNMTFQVGARPSDTLDIEFSAMNTDALHLSGTSVALSANASLAGDAIQTAMLQINNSIAYLGGKKSQISSLSQNLAVSIQNQSAAKSAFTDADIPQSLLDTQQYQSLLDTASASFQKTLRQQSDLARLAQQVLS